MTPAIYTYVEHLVKTEVIPSTGKILEVGSKNVNGSVRELFRSADYIGVDLEPGVGVDRVMNAAHMTWVNEFDLVLCLEMLEHDPKPWLTIEAMRIALKRGGKMVISVPTTGFPEHRHPVDVFRYMPDAFSLFFFDQMRMIDLAGVKCQQGYPGLIGVGAKL